MCVHERQHKSPEEDSNRLDNPAVVVDNENRHMFL